MVLKYSFEYLSNNNTLINFLIRIADEANIDYEIIRKDDFIEFYCSADTHALTSIANTISSDLPVSMFLKNSEVEEAENMPEKSNFQDKEEAYFLPFCPKCLENIENKNSVDFNNPLTTCDLCAPSHHNVLDLKFRVKGSIETIENYSEFVEQLALRIVQKEKVRIQTISGEYIFEALNIQENEKNSILCLDLMQLETLFVAKKSEVIALASIEKPQINLRFNEIFKQKNNCTVENANVRFIDDLFLYMLSKALQKHEIYFLSYSKKNSFDCEVINDLTQVKSINTPAVQLTPDDRVMVLNNQNYNSSLTSIYNKFDDKNKGHFMVLLQENNLYDNSILNFYSSSIDDDNVSVYSNNIGSFLDILNYELPNSMQSLFDAISEDETGKKLLENYKKHFPMLVEDALSFDMNSLNKHSIVSLWKVVRVILGFEHTLLNHAMSSFLEKGPRIDYKFFEQEKIYNKKFNFLKLIRSGMSFKLAGVDNNTIALGYVESYAHFIANIVDEVNSEIALDGISLCGDIFANNLISNFVHKNITKNYKIYYNKDFVIQIS